MAWSEKDYQDALAAQAENPHPEFEAAIKRYEAEHLSSEERGAKHGFISQQYPTSSDNPERPLPETPEPMPSRRTAGGFGPYSVTSQQYPETQLSGDMLPRENIETAQEASRRIVQRPPELINPPGPQHPLTSPLSAVYDYLPSWMGGKTEMWEEPKLIDFRSDPDMRAALGPGIDKLGPDSPEYKDYADRRWAEAYDTAALSGQNIVRQSAVSSVTEDFAHLGPSVNKAFTALGRGIDGMIGGAQPMVLPGVKDPALQAAADESPFAGALGGLFGATKGVAGALGDALAGATGLGKGGGVVGEALKGAATGGGTAAGIQGLNDLGDVARGNPHADETARIAEALGLGGLGGALAGAGGAETRRLRDPLTPEGRQLNLQETALAGGEGNPPERATRFFGGLKVTPGAEDVAAESLALGPNRGASPTDILAGKVAGPIAKTAMAEDAALQAEVARTNRNFYSSKAGQSQVAPQALVGKLRNRIESGTFDDGSPLPLEHTNDLKSALNDAVEVFPVEPGDEGSWARRYKGNVISVAKANQLGLRVAGPDTNSVIMIPKPMNAEQMDIMLRNVDSKANAASIRGSADPIWGELQRAGRVDRDRFGSDMSLGKVDPVTLPDGTVLKGWGAYKSRASDQITDVQRRMLNAGIPQGKNVGIEQATQGVRQNAIGFREPNRSPQDEALMSFMGGQTGPLWDITSARYGRTMQPSGLSRTSVARNLLLRLDPTFARAEKYGRPIGVAAGAGNFGPGMVAGYHDLKDMSPFTFQELMDKLRGKTPEERKNHD